MAVSRARPGNTITQRNRHPGIRRALMVAPVGAAVATAVLSAGTAHAADSVTTPLSGFGGCLDVQGAGTANFTPVQSYGCNGTNAQQWTVVPAGSTLHALGKCLDVQYGGTTDGTPVELYDCNGTGAQVWIPQGNGALYNPQSGKCLDDTGWATGSQVQIWDCTGNPNQSWTGDRVQAG